ncbi:MAG TPA: polysaccharide deacetylase family protein [Pyrinomonadaceae bacterium]|jgi:peptidoglycan/xylan/chitin deacetylase (PgdA/CDA1 family)|nr:polysaccharide deacetylase family protein [Pyrinomonadaceae bacterium]
MKHFFRPHRLAVILVAIITLAGAVRAQSASTAGVKQGQREVAVTIDDLPGLYVTRLDEQRAVIGSLLRSLAANKVPAIGFVNEKKLYERGRLDGQRVALLRDWLDAGQELGNHTFSHVSAGAVPLAAYEQDVIRGETVVKDLLQQRGMKLKYFRHPELKTGPTVAYRDALDQFLAGRGYTTAPVTIDNQDFIFAAVYSRAKARGDKVMMKKVADDYIAYMEQVFKFFEELSVETLGYEVKQTLLLHASELNAEHLDELIAMLRGRGYRFVTLEEALSDDAYKLPAAQTTQGLSWLHRWRLAKGLPLLMEPREPASIQRLYRQATPVSRGHAHAVTSPPRAAG